MLRVLTIVKVFVFSTGILFAEKSSYNSVLGVPLRFNNPIDIFYNPSLYNDYIINTGKKHNSQAWIVFSDRDDNQAYNSPNESSVVKSGLNFASPFYVVEEQGEWIKLIQTPNPPDGLQLVDKNVKEIGWVKKTKMLLWSKGLVDENTKINRKAFLLNKAKDIANVINLVDKKLVNIYKGPLTTRQFDDRTIFSFYFIFKKHKLENGTERYLLGTEVALTPYRVETQLIGWVTDNRCTDWNTRLALEPNFSKDAFEERKASRTFQIRAFSNQQSAKIMGSMANVVGADVFWDKDPVLLDTRTMANSNPMRFKGGVVRFPMLGAIKLDKNSNQNPSFVYSSGMIGEIKVRREAGQTKIEVIEENTYANVVDIYKKTRDAIENINLFFLIEGTSSMQAYKEKIYTSIRSAVSELGSGTKLKMGYGIYRDESDALTNSDVNIFPLTKNYDEFYSSLKGNLSLDGNDNDPYTCAFYALKKSLVEAKFVPGQTNIIIWLGQNGDLKYSRSRKATAQSTGSKYLIDNTDDLVQDIANIGIHLHQIQLYNDGTPAMDRFSKSGQSLILESAKIQYTSIQQIKDHIPSYSVPTPEINLPETGMGGVFKLSDGAVTSSIQKPSVNNDISGANLNSAIVMTINDTKKYMEGFNKLLDETFSAGAAIVSEGRNVSVGSFAAPMAKFLLQYVNVKDNKTDLSSEDMKNITGEKYQLYNEVYFPSKVKGANHESFSYVLYMPDVDLDQYIRNLEGIFNAASSSYDKKREAIMNGLKKLYEEMSGDKNLSSESFSKVSINDLVNRMNGLKDEGFILTPNLQNVNIGDITDERLVSNAMIEQMTKNIITKVEKLNKIKQLGKKYEFSYESGDNLYYWIPVEDTF